MIHDLYERFSQAMKKAYVHLVSDATGETVLQIFRAAKTYFSDVEFIEYIWSLVRTKTHLDKVVERIKDHPGMVFYTLTDKNQRKFLEEECANVGSPTFSVLDAPTAFISDYVDMATASKPKNLHSLDAAYFDRIEAMEFAMRHDDGQSTESILEADVILIGVSRTSKSPTCIYLANRGLKACNIPFVPGCSLPDSVLQLDNSDHSKPMVFGLTQDVNYLIRIRKNRMIQMGTHDHTDYIDFEGVKNEINMARRLFNEKAWPIIDVTGRSIEETSAAIFQIYLEAGRKVAL